MVAVRASEAERFAAGPPEGIRLFLVHGDDAGGVTETARALERMALQRGGGDAVLRFGSDELSATPGRIAEEAFSASLFGGEPVLSLRVLDGRHNVLGAVKPLLNTPPAASWLVVEAGELETKSALRKAFEMSRAAAAVPVYHAEGADLAASIRSAATDAGILIEPDALETLADLLGGDRQATRRELEKLFLYVGDAGVATATDVAAVVGDAAEGQSDAIVAAALGGDSERTDAEFGRYLAGGGSAATLSALLLRHLVLLASLRAELDGGFSVSATLDRARLPIFGRRRAGIEADLKLWTGEALAAARRRVFEAIALTRMQPSLDDAVISEALQSLALIARRLMRRAAA